jgi:hypothetical protein
MLGPGRATDRGSLILRQALATEARGARWIRKISRRGCMRCPQDRNFTEQRRQTFMDLAKQWRGSRYVSDRQASK